MSRQKGFTLLELLIVVAIIGILAAVAIPAMRAYIDKSRYAAALAECRALYTAFFDFYIENGMYPYQSAPPAFDKATFSPLNYQGSLARRMVNDQADAYDSPDDRGTNQEFWLRMSLKEDPTVQFVIAQSDNVDLEPGVWLDGVFVYRNGVRVKL